MITDKQIEAEARACVIRHDCMVEGFGGMETDYFVIAKEMATWAREQLKSGMRPTFDEWLETIDKSIHGPFYQGGGLTHYYPNHMRMAWDACETFMSFMVNDHKNELKRLEVDNKVYPLDSDQEERKRFVNRIKHAANELDSLLMKREDQIEVLQSRVNDLEESVARAVKQAHDAGLEVTKLRKENFTLETMLARKERKDV